MSISGNRKEMMQIVTKSDINVSVVQQCGGDHMIVAAAKVCTSGAESCQLATAECSEANSGLINYLVKHRHGSPFEHGSITFYVHAPLFVWREWHRHRIGFCLAGDTEIWTESVRPGGERTLRKRPIKELYQNWHIGVVDKAHSRKAGVAGYSVVVEERTRLLPSCRNFKCRVLNESTQLFETGKPCDIIESGIKELLLVQTEAGHSLKCSKDHRILTDAGWMAAGDLRKGDRIAVNGKRSKFAERQVPPSLRRGIGVWTSMQRNRLIAEEDKCYLCGDTHLRSNLSLDHVIPVVTDLGKALDINNLKPICPTCHGIKSGAEQKLAQRCNVAGSKYVKLLATPTSCGEEMTYDVSMEGPHHNFVANGIVVHNSYNEESARYKQLEPVFYIPDRDRPMMKVDGWKPGRPKFTVCETDEVYELLCNNLKKQYQSAYEAYESNLALGVDPGLARDCLPVGIYSGCWVTCNPRSLMAFLSLRTHEPTADKVSYPLWEIEIAARKCEEALKQYWPLTYAAFVANGRAAP